MTFFVDESVIMEEKDNEIQWIKSDYTKQLYYEIKTMFASGENNHHASIRKHQ